MTTLPAAKSSTHEHVRAYYGSTISTTADLQTSACCVNGSLPTYLKEIQASLEPEITERFYGCGSPIPPLLEGRTVLDLGCGTGRDAYICSKLVGETGRVIGVDMTKEQLEIALRHRAAQAERFGHEASNVSLHLGAIEDLAALGVEDASIDVVISNCVINLAPDKRSVFAEALRVLKPGGELLFSDVFADRRIPEPLKTDPVLVGECLAGALYVEDFRRIMGALGVPDYRVLSSRLVTISNEDIAAKLGPVRFYSITVRAFKLAGLEDRCEDYGQVATYLGTIQHTPNSFVLDNHHEFFTGKPMLVCGNTAQMLSETRLAPHFKVQGSRETHFGLFDCAGIHEASSGDAGVGGCC